MGDFRIGLLVPQYSCEVSTSLARAREAEAAGIDIWLAGQMLPISRDPEKSALEPLTLMGALAAATTRSRLGFMALAAPYLPPFYLAKAMITLDHISGGRLDIGIGAGWRQSEFELLEVPFGKGSDRRDRLQACVEMIVGLSSGSASLTTATPEAPRIKPHPKARQQPHPPLWIAGQGRQVLGTVARYGDWANFARGISVEDFKEAAAYIAGEAARHSRPDSGPRLSLTGAFLAEHDRQSLEAVLSERGSKRGLSASGYGDELRASGAFVGTIEEIAAQLAPYIDAGCEYAILWPLVEHDPKAPGHLASLTAEVRRRGIGAE